ncbi:MAG: GNAT family N-acetyltransferase [Thermoplasmatota archaeon]
MRVAIRAARAGDLGWTFHRQALLYRREFGYLPLFETYLAEGLAPFLAGFDASRDRLWMARSGDCVLGFVAIQHDGGRRTWAKLRWFWVEREARGMGLGSRLLATAVRFSRRAGYEGVYLWTVDDLAAARKRYVEAGFRLAFEDPKPCPWAPWGHEQRWELALKRPT